jgi:hypothetical protein
MKGHTKYDDQKSYLFHKKDDLNRCFACGCSPERLLIVRHIASMMLVHLCPDCMVNGGDDYLLDNTRPWIGGK